jgi:hypothetical protein
LEKEKRKLLAEISELQEQLLEAKQRVGWRITKCEYRVRNNCLSTIDSRWF